MENNYVQNNNEVQPQANNSIVSLGDWLVTILLLGIPLVNLIMLFVWGFGSTTPVSKKNFARAYLIFAAIGIVLLVLFWGAIFALIASNPNFSKGY